MYRKNRVFMWVGGSLLALWAAVNLASGSLFLPFPIDRPRATAVADLDGDGNEDLVIAHVLSNQVSILRGDGNGNFFPFPSSPIDVPDRPTAVGVRNLSTFNPADTEPDLVLAVAGNLGITSSSGGLIPVVRTLVGTISAGDVTFDPAQQNDFFLGDLPFSLVMEDFDGVGEFDIAVTVAGEDKISLLLGQADASFLLGPETAVGDGPAAIVSGNWNGDFSNGKPIMDLAVANSGDHSVSILLGNNNGTFQIGSTLPACSSCETPSAIAVDDFDGDTNKDLVVAYSKTDRVAVFLGDGTGVFGDGAGGTSPAQILTLTTGNTPADLVAVDLDGASGVDLAVVNFGSDSLSVFLNNGQGVFPSSPATFSLESSPRATRNPIALVGLAGAPPDLLAVHFDTDNYTLLENQSTPGLPAFAAPKLGNSSGIDDPIRLETGRFNVGGKEDLLLLGGNGGSELLQLLVGIDPDRFRRLSHFSSPVTGIGPTVPADFNGDSFTDLAVAGRNGADPGIQILLGTLEGIFNSGFCSPGSDNPGVRCRGDEECPPDGVGVCEANFLITGEIPISLAVGELNPTDLDFDRVPDHLDNCPTVTNSGQGGSILPGTCSGGGNDGDCCTGDSDCSPVGICVPFGVCSFLSPSPGATCTTDGDCPGGACLFHPRGMSCNSCSADADADSIPDLLDNCPAAANPLQTDTDLDGIGDSCEKEGTLDLVSVTDVDGGDGKGEVQVFPGLGDGTFHEDTGFLIDGPPLPTGVAIGDFNIFDMDMDRAVDFLDNCPTVANPTQQDTNTNGRGDACEDSADPDPCGDSPGVPDCDADGVDNSADNCPAVANALQEDTNGNGVGDLCESRGGPLFPAADLILTHAGGLTLFTGNGRAGFTSLSSDLIRGCDPTTILNPGVVCTNDAGCHDTAACDSGDLNGGGACVNLGASSECHATANCSIPEEPPEDCNVLGLGAACGAGGAGTCDGNGDGTCVGNGDGTCGLFSDPQEIVPSLTPLSLFGTGLFDVDRPEGIAVIDNTETIHILVLGTSTGVFIETGQFSAVVSSPTVGDLNGDLIGDLIWADPVTNKVRVWMGAGQGKFFPAPGSPYDVGDDPAALAVIQSNDDTGDLLANPNDDPDIAVVHQGSRNLLILRNLLRDRADMNGSGRVDGFDLSELARNFGFSYDLLVTPPPAGALSDVDLDGDVDGSDLAILTARFGETL